ncbi:MAG: hypothetical protein J1E80_04630 [Desulfovibrionaceae bacterium]|nr:hypothetical protein [Desulfovibrionaceae bacterium]
MSISLMSALRGAAGPIHHREENIWEQSFCFESDFVGFAGHFPQKPVLPAAVQIAMIRLLWQESVGTIDALEVLSAKYMSPILPHERILVRLSLVSSHKGKAEFFIRDEERLRLVSAVQVKPLQLEV